jgi:hypothetical protein
MRRISSFMLDQHNPSAILTANVRQGRGRSVDAYFSADVETDGPIPGPYSMLSFAIVFAGTFDGQHFSRPVNYENRIYKELKPISDQFQVEALKINGLDRPRLCKEGEAPERAMTEASRWVKEISKGGEPVLVAYPLSFDWTWLYWYFVRYSQDGSPFGYSRCFDLKTAHAVKAGLTISSAGRSQLRDALRSGHKHTHHAMDDAIAQAEIFANIFEWEGEREQSL